MPVFSESFERCLDLAYASAVQQLHESIEIEHLLLALLDEPSAAALLRHCGANLSTLRSHLRGTLASGDPARRQADRPVQAQVSPALQSVIQHATAKAGDPRQVTGADAVLSVLAAPGSKAAACLNEHGVTWSKATQALKEHGAVTSDRGENKGGGELDADLHRTFQDALLNARRRRHALADIDHLLLALLDNSSAAEVITARGAEIQPFREQLLERLRDLPKEPGTAQVDTDLSPAIQELLSVALQRLREAGATAPRLSGSDLMRVFLEAIEEASSQDNDSPASESEFRARHTDREATVLELQRDAAEARAGLAQDRARHLPALAIALQRWGALIADTGDAQSLDVTTEAVTTTRELMQSDDDWIEPLAGALINQSLSLGHMRSYSQAINAAEEAVELFRRLHRKHTGSNLRGLAGAWNALSLLRREAEMRAGAVQAGEEAVGFARQWLKLEQDSPLSRQLLAACLTGLGTALQQRQQHAQALMAIHEAAALFEQLASIGSEEAVRQLAISLMSLGVSYSQLGRHYEAFAPSIRCVELFAGLAGQNDVDASRHVGALSNLAGRYIEAGLPDKALEAAGQAHVAACRLTQRNRVRFLYEEAVTAGTRSRCLHAVGRIADALPLVQSAVELLREIDLEGSRNVKIVLAGNLTNLSGRLSESGRHDEAIAYAREGLRVCRECLAADNVSYAPDLAMHLNNVAGFLLRVDLSAEAVEAIEEAATLTSSLIEGHRETFLLLHASTLEHQAQIYLAAERLQDAKDCVAKAVDAFRSLANAHRDAYLPNLARGLATWALVASLNGQLPQALEAAREARAHLSGLAETQPAAFVPELLVCLRNLANIHAELGQPAAVRQLMLESAKLLLESEPTDPHRWVSQAEHVTATLNESGDLTVWFLPLLRQLPEHRELAYDGSQADAFLGLQAQVASRTWTLAGALSDHQGDLLDDAVALLISTLHSPDLARWLQARGSDDSSLAELARCKREVIAADQLLQTLLLQMRPDAPETSFTPDRHAGSQATLQHRIVHQQEAVRDARARFRARRQETIAADPRFRGTFEAARPEHLRACARHGGAHAALFLLQLPQGSDTTRAVGALVPSGNQRIQLLEFDGLVSLCQQAAAYRPHAGSNRAMRNADAPPQDPSLQLPLEGLAQQLQTCFWQPLHAAVPEFSLAAGSLHVCCHGILHQVPLGLAPVHAQARTHAYLWPGLPYLRIAAERGPSPEPPVRQRAWLLGYDCAWNTRIPLPMVAIEADLLRQMLQAHGCTVALCAQAQPSDIPAASALRGQWGGLVACCHGRRDDAHFDTALALGGQPLSVADIVQQRFAATLALLPACHAGETRDDAAGNSLGIAAAFLLGGTRVVAASSKSVSDLLMPWLSTLTVWHVLQGLAQHDAALLARDQVGQRTFPEDYRRWLRSALPQALSLLQPGGAEHHPTAQAQRALKDLADDWPWEGDTTALFDADAARREVATQSVCEGVLLPRGGLEGCLEVDADLREMTGFLMVYGVQ